MKLIGNVRQKFTACVGFQFYGAARKKMIIIIKTSKQIVNICGRTIIIIIIISVMIWDVSSGQGTIRYADCCSWSQYHVPSVYIWMQSRSFLRGNPSVYLFMESFAYYEIMPHLPNPVRHLVIAIFSFKARLCAGVPLVRVLPFKHCFVQNNKRCLHARTDPPRSRIFERKSQPKRNAVRSGTGKTNVK